MKILHVVQGYFPGIGGTEFLIQRISEEVAAQFNDQVTVFTMNCYNAEGFNNPDLPCFKAGWDEVNKIPVRRFPVKSWVSQLFTKPQHFAYSKQLPLNDLLRNWAHGPIVPGLVNEIRKFPADIVAASSFPLLHMYAALNGAQRSNRPCVLHGALHPDDHWSTDRPQIYTAIHRSNAYIANTEYEANFVISRGVDPAKVHVIGVGVDPEPFEKISSSDAKKRFGLENRPVIGFIGQVAEHKIDMLIHAMPKVWQLMPEATLLIAGSRTIYADRMEKIIAQWPERNRQRVKLIYNFDINEKPWLYSAIDVLAYPSMWESFGIAYLEAWAAGKPVIGCNRGAIPWVIKAGKDGLLVDYQNYDMLANAIALLLRSPEWAHEMGANGKKKMLARYTWTRIGQRFHEVYQNVLENHKDSSK